MAHSFRFSPTKLCNLIKILFRFGSVLEGSFVALMRLGHLWLSEVMMRWSSNTLGSVISYYLKRANGGEREGGGKGEGEGEGEGGGNGVAKTDIWLCDGKIYLLHSQGSAIFLWSPTLTGNQFNKFIPSIYCHSFILCWRRLIPLRSPWKPCDPQNPPPPPGRWGLL